MRLFAFIPILALILLSAASSDAARPGSEPSFSILHNSPPVVEQQGQGLACTTWHTDPVTGITYWDGGSLAECVTNTGSCVWDADDYLRTSRGGEGSVSACSFADWTAHAWVVAVRDFNNRTKPFDTTLSFTRNSGEVQTFDMHVEDGYGLMCVIGPDYDRQSPRPELVPLQGGGGLTQGYAVPTTVTASLQTAERRSRGLSLTLEARLSSTVYCPRDVPILTVSDGSSYYQVAKSD